MAYPDAYVQDGVIRDIRTHHELPSYEGLCLSKADGRSCIMITNLTDAGRAWDLVHWGSEISSTEIERYMKGNSFQQKN